jgi:homoserine kinase
VRLPVPAWLHAAVVRPHFPLETRTSRAVLAAPYALHDFVVQSEGLALVLAGCLQGDASLIRRGFRDVLVEPRRAPLIAGFAGVKAAALESGALGASISGGGPSVFAWFDSRSAAERGAAAMADAFARAGHGSDRLVSPVGAAGARVLARSCKARAARARRPSARRSRKASPPTAASTCRRSCRRARATGRTPCRRSPST